jgi:ABC-type bacteriocin/lantibiotic exporter with double-glycine peptidase domain
MWKVVGIVLLIIVAAAILIGVAGEIVYTIKIRALEKQIRAEMRKNSKLLRSYVEISGYVDKETSRIVDKYDRLLARNIILGLPDEEERCKLMEIKGCTLDDLVSRIC